MSNNKKINIRINRFNTDSFTWDLLSGTNTIATSAATFTRRRDAVRSVRRTMSTLGVNTKGIAFIGD